MPKKNQPFTMIHEAFRRGSIENTGLNERLVKYKREERKLTEAWAGRDLSQEEARPAYQKQAKHLGDMWVELVVDIAMFHGTPMDRRLVSDIKAVLVESIDDSIV